MEASEFAADLKARLGDKYEFALRLFKAFGETFSDDVYGIIEIAIENGKLQEALDRLETSFLLRFRGKKKVFLDDIDDDKLAAVRADFEEIYKNTLGVNFAEVVEVPKA